MDDSPADGDLGDAGCPHATCGGGGPQWSRDPHRSPWGSPCSECFPEGIKLVERTHDGAGEKCKELLWTDPPFPSAPKGLSSTETGCPEEWLNNHPCKYLGDV